MKLKKGRLLQIIKEEIDTFVAKRQKVVNENISSDVFEIYNIIKSKLGEEEFTKQFLNTFTDEQLLEKLRFVAKMNNITLGDGGQEREIKGNEQ